MLNTVNISFLFNISILSYIILKKKYTLTFMPVHDCFEALAQSDSPNTGTTGILRFSPELILMLNSAKSRRFILLLLDSFLLLKL